jgi:hypothetical protein
MVKGHSLGTQPYSLPNLTGSQVHDGTAQPAKVIDGTGKAKHGSYTGMSTEVDW